MNILVINSGSSSLKYQIIDMSTGIVLEKGLVDKIGYEDAKIKYERNEKKFEIIKDIKNHEDALNDVIKVILGGESPSIKSLNEIDAIGHRVVHGGEYFAQPVMIDAEVLLKIEKCEAIAPLHNPANKKGILACMKLMPHNPQVAVFDTAFHQTISPENYIYALPFEFYEKYKIRKYGFHGTSHKYVSQRLAAILQQDIKDLNIIACHVGNGASIAAIKGGESIYTSMGFTPLQGLTMGTRCGDIDVSIAMFLMENEGLTLKEVEEIMNKKSGVLGISGVSSDMRDIEGGYIHGHERCMLAMNKYVNDIVKYIGAYHVLLGRTDYIIFTAGTLENSALIRELIGNKLSALGVAIDSENNKFRGEERIISTKDSHVKVIVIPTNEEYMIAKETFELVEKI